MNRIVVLLLAGLMFATPMLCMVEVSPKQGTLEVAVGQVSTRATLVVGPGQTYTKIQDAIDNASAGDTVRVWAGTYNECLSLNKTLTLIGNGTIDTIIDANNTGNGIHIDAPWCNVSKVKVIGGWNYGIITLSPFTKMVDLNVSNGWIGFMLDHPCYNNTIERCMMTNNGHFSVYAVHSENDIITNNILINNGHGFCLQQSDGTYVYNNTMIKNKEGIILSDSTDINVTKNTMVDNGLTLAGYQLGYVNSHSIDTTNTVNGKPLYYWKDGVGGIVPSGAGQVILVNCTNSSVIGQNIGNLSTAVGLKYCRGAAVEGNRLSDCRYLGVDVYGYSGNKVNNNTISNSMGGIYFVTSFGAICNNTIINTTLDGIDFSGSYDTIENNTISNASYGMGFSTASQNSINRNNITSCRWYGISAGYYSSQNSITNNMLRNNKVGGIRIQSTDGNLINNNTIIKNGYGIYLRDSSHIVVSHKRISNNIQGGVDLVSSCDSNQVISNEIRENSAFGLNIEQGINNTITFNRFLNNLNYAMYVMSSTTRNYIHHNTINGNNNNATQAWDDSTNRNYWDNGSIGNYWSDWTTPDTDNNGIVDIPYYIAGNQNNRDNFPLTHPWGIPKLEATLITVIYEGHVYNVHFKVTDDDTDQTDLLWSVSTNATWLTFESDHTLNGTPAQSDVGTYWVNVSVSDGENSDFANFTLLVLPTNDPPIIAPDLPNITLIEDTPQDHVICLKDYISDPDNTFSQLDVDVYSEYEIDPSYGGPIGLEYELKTGYVNVICLQPNWTYPIKMYVDVTDPYAVWTSGNFYFNFVNVTDPPVITRHDSYPFYEEQNDSFLFEAVDDRTPRWDLVWTVTSNATFLEITNDGGYAHLFGKPTNEDVGTYWANVSVFDEEGAYDFVNFTFEVFDSNDPPEITTSNVLVCKALVPYTVQYKALDIDKTHDRLEWSLNTTAPFLSIDNLTGLLYGTPTLDELGTYHVNITVTDGRGGYDDTEFTLKVVMPTQPPKVSIPEPSVTFPEDTIDTSIDLNSWFTDPDGDILKFSFSCNTYVNVTIMENSRVALRPPENWSGTDSVKFYANDSFFGVSDTIYITVTPVNDAPYDAKILLPEHALVVGGDQTVYGTAKDVDLSYGDELNYTWYSGTSGFIGYGQYVNLSLPAGKHDVTLKVIDSWGAITLATVTVDVQGPETLVVPTDDDDDDDHTGYLGYLVPIVIILAALLSVLLAVILVSRGKRPEPPPPERPKQRIYRRIRYDRQKLEKILDELPEVENVEVPPDPTGAPLFTGIPSADEVVDEGTLTEDQVNTTNGELNSIEQVTLNDKEK